VKREAGHFCDVRLLPGECVVCVGKPRPVIHVDSWAGRQTVEVEILGHTPKRVRVRFLSDCRKGPIGTVRLLAPEVVVMPAAHHGGG
jgi:hypothetical protein